ncbi:MAG: septal ring lytic transglycosylase RlpA family protein [Burkholderiales bacterium]
MSEGSVSKPGAPAPLSPNREEGRRDGSRCSAFVLQALGCLAIAAALSACGSAPKRDAVLERTEPPKQVSKASPSPAPRATRGGGYYLDDGPGEAPPADLESIPEAVPKLEPLHRGAMRPYVVLGQSFTPMTELTPYKAQGIATWYGRRYHGKPTSSGEPYDMYSMTAAHPVLPIPSYVRVTNVANSKSVVVRVNDRGPFIDNRLIDLSYTAAHRIGVLAGGSALVEVESVIPDGSAPATTYAAAPPAASRPAVSSPNAGTAPASARAKASAPAPQNSDSDPILAIAAAARDVGAAQAQPDTRNPAAGTLGEAAAPADARGVYLQLGAFGSRDNAESYLVRAKVQFEWLAERLHVLPREGLFRVHAGPYSSATEARQVAERIALSLGVRPVVVTR